MAILAALVAGLLAGWAFARGRSGRLAWSGMAGGLGAGLAAAVAALAGDEPLIGAALGVASAGLVMRDGTAREPRGLGGAGAPRLVFLLIALLALRLGVALGGGLPLAADEAQYWDWSRSLDLAYYSKPGGIAWLLAAWTELAGDTLIGLRLLGLGLATATVALVWRTGLGLGDRALAWRAAVLFAVLPLSACTAGLITTDVPLLLCWTAFLAVLLVTPAAGGTAAWWHGPVLGLLLAAGVNAKYAMLYAPLALVLAAPALPGLRAWLHTPAPWLALAIGVAGLLPMLWWNAEHGWVGLQHVIGQGGVGRDVILRPGRIAEFLGGQLAVALPVSLLLPWACRWAWRERAVRPAAWLLACAALTPLALLLLVSVQAKVQANWAALAWPPAALLVAWWLPGAPAAARRVALGGALLAGLVALLVAAVPALRARFPALPPSVPERKLAGWAELADAVARLRDEAQPSALVLTAGYDVAAELAWHDPAAPRPLCANFGRRLNQYDLWEQLDARHVGRDVVFVRELERDDALAGDLRDRLPAGLAADFAACDQPCLLRIARGGRTWRSFLLVRLRGFDGHLDSVRPAERF